MEKIPKSDYVKISAVAKKLKLDFIRIFGSGAKSLQNARDIDVAIGLKKLNLSEYSLLVSTLQNIFHKQIDVVQLKSGLNPILVKGIAKNSIPIWENRNGKIKYIEMIDRLHAIAIDDLLSFPREWKLQSIRKTQRKLNA